LRSGIGAGAGRERGGRSQYGLAVSGASARLCHRDPNSPDDGGRDLSAGSERTGSRLACELRIRLRQSRLGVRRLTGRRSRGLGRDRPVLGLGGLRQSAVRLGVLRGLRRRLILRLCGRNLRRRLGLLDRGRVGSTGEQS
jgi:hypothetical protein